MSAGKAGGLPCMLGRRPCPPQCPVDQELTRVSAPTPPGPPGAQWAMSSCMCRRQGGPERGEASLCFLAQTPLQGFLFPATE